MNLEENRLFGLVSFFASLSPIGTMLYIFRINEISYFRYLEWPNFEFFFFD